MIIFIRFLTIKSSYDLDDDNDQPPTYLVYVWELEVAAQSLRVVAPGAHQAADQSPEMWMW